MRRPQEGPGGRVASWAWGGARCGAGREGERGAGETHAPISVVSLSRRRRGRGRLRRQRQGQEAVQVPRSLPLPFFASAPLAPRIRTPFGTTSCPAPLLFLCTWQAVRASSAKAKFRRRWVLMCGLGVWRGTRRWQHWPVTNPDVLAVRPLTSCASGMANGTGG